MNIGVAIKSIRKKTSVTQKELAQKCNLTQTSLSQIELGKKRPSAKTLTRICNALNVPEALVYIVAMEDTDVPDSKKVVYGLVFPSLKALTLQLIDPGPEDVQAMSQLEMA